MDQDHPTTTIFDYTEFVSGEDAPIIVGGQAVNLWCFRERFFSTDTYNELQQFEPFVSKDCDVFGDKSLLQKLRHRTQLECVQFKFGQRTSCVGFLYAPDDPNKTPIIEVLAKVHGLKDAEIGKGIEVELDGMRYRTLNPLQILKAKLANAIEITQTRRQDVRHVQMIIPCLRAYIVSVHSSCSSDDEDSIKFCKRLLTRCLEVVKSDHAKAAEARYNIDAWKCFPIDVLKNSPFNPVQSFWKHQLEPHFT